MPFTAFHKHCTKCKEESPCTNRHVYVMLLKPEVFSIKKFKEANQEKYRKGMPCLYVGKTAHHPKCRQTQHVHCKVGEWKGKVWTCYCNKKPGQHACKISTRGSGVVGKFNTGWLKPQLYKEFNPQEGSQANSEAEKELTEHLRGLGYGVWAGHLDQKKGK